MTVEGPAIARIYRLFNAPEKFHFVRFDYGHNYNQTSREAVYGWFDQWLLKGRPAKVGAASENTPIAEAPYQKEPDNDLRVWPDDNLPPDALAESEFTNLLIRQYQKEWQEMVPRNRSSLAGFKESILPAWRRTLLVEWPQFQTESKWKVAGKTGVDLEISLPSESAKVAAVYFAPKTEVRSRKPERIIVLADPVGNLAARDDSGEPTGFVKQLHAKGEKVLAIKSFSTGEPKDQFTNHYTTYNRTKLQERVRDLVAVCAQARTIGEGKARSGRPQIILCAVGPAGVWAMLAAPAADAVIADCNQYDLRRDAHLLSPDLFCPGIRKLGGFEAGAMLAAPNRLLLHNVGEGFSTQSIEATYKVSGARNLRIEAGRLSDEDLAGWIAALD